METTREVSAASVVKLEESRGVQCVGGQTLSFYHVLEEYDLHLCLWKQCGQITLMFISPNLDLELFH